MIQNKCCKKEYDETQRTLSQLMFNYTQDPNDVKGK